MNNAVLIIKIIGLILLFLVTSSKWHQNIVWLNLLLALLLAILFADIYKTIKKIL